MLLYIGSGHFRISRSNCIWIIVFTMHAAYFAHLILLYSVITLWTGRAIAEAVSRWLPIAAARVRAQGWQMGFVVDKVPSGQVFPKYFGFPCQNRSFHQLLHPHNHPGQTRIGLATSWSPVRGDLLTVLDLVTEMKRKVLWRRPGPKIWAVEPQEKKIFSEQYKW
jgi:hypothetical protein